LGPVLAVTWLVAGCATSSTPSQGTAPEPTDPAALEALYRARTDSARLRFSPADAAFVTGMMAHHAQAIDMAELAPGRAAGASIGTLAARIINAQRDEIAWMERWLRDREQAVPGPGAGGDHGGHLPGMLTPAQLTELASTRGSDFDRLFLTYMIQHHRGAVAMVLELLDTDGAVQDPATFKLASDIHVDQTTEIARMEQMLSAMP
jgi:uncharacterized protein (DUF305 family)